MIDRRVGADLCPSLISFASLMLKPRSMVRSLRNCPTDVSVATGSGSFFPQLAGLGSSAMARHYGIRDLDQAKRYLANPILGSRLRQDVRLIMRHKGRSASEILGSPDDLELRSCLTLFGQAASDQSDRALFKAALDQFYGGEPDRRTVELLTDGRAASTRR